MVLDAIAIYLKSLPKVFTFSLNSTPPNVHNIMNKRTSVSVISIINIDGLHDYLLFFLLNLPFQSRKAEDFYYWSIALYFKKFGYFFFFYSYYYNNFCLLRYLSKDKSKGKNKKNEGRILVYNISQYVNKSRYSTNPNCIIAPNLSKIKGILNIKLPVTLQPNMLHVNLAKAFANKVTHNAILVYDKGKLINETPFNSFVEAMVAIGYSKTSIAARRSLDTGKLIGGRYTFYSKPL